MHRSLVLYCLLLLCPVLLPAETWNILVYMAADNNLAEYAVQDFNSMETVALPPGTKVWIQTDLPQGHSLSGSRRWALEQNNTESISSRQLANLGTLSSGNPQTLSNFITWGLNQYEADRKMLVIWSHGSGWSKAGGSKWICSDYGSEEALSVADGDLKAALSGHPGFDILLFDACSMQTIEVAYEVKNFADFVIGSAELVPVTGFPYPEILPLFNQDLPSILQQIPALYAGSYAGGGSQNPYSSDLLSTCSVIDSEALGNFVEHWGAFSRDFRNSAPEIRSAREYCWELNYGADIDLGELLSVLEQSSDNLDLMNRAQQLRQLWQGVVLSQASSGIVAPVGSASLWFPRYSHQFNSTWAHYAQLDFARSRWLSLLNQAWQPMLIPALAPTQLNVSQVPGGLVLSFQAVNHPDSVYYLVSHSDQGFEDIPYYTSQNGGTIRIILNAPREGTFGVRAVYPDQQSPEATVNYSFTASAARLLVYPNPGRTGLWASWNLAEEPVNQGTASIYNLRGQLLWQKVLPVNASGNLFLGAEPQLQSLPAGIYFLDISHSPQRLRTRFLIQ